ncbi:MAG: peptide deformylase [Elusimicrobiota bacterium]|jgi:peptide deformylase|nr:peptide deformylase [Elusimicrobiota bacterium]
MSKLTILKYGDPILRKKSIEIKDITQDIKKLAFDMLETMYAAPGVGLAAPQIGVNIRLLVVDINPPDKKNPLIMLNPVIIKAENKIDMEEGCLSFPGFYEAVKRFEYVDAEYATLDGKRKTILANGFLSKAIQHEIDHLDAKLFIDYLADWKRKAVEKEIKRKKKVGQW